MPTKQRSLFDEVKMRGAVARRRAAHFGWRYGYESWRIEPGPPIPDDLLGLRERSAELAVSNAELQREIIQRKSVEQSLKKSEQHHARMFKQAQQMQEKLQHSASVMTEPPMAWALVSTREARRQDRLAAKRERRMGAEANISPANPLRRRGTIPTLLVQK